MPCAMSGPGRRGDTEALESGLVYIGEIDLGVRMYGSGIDPTIRHITWPRWTRIDE